MPDDLAQFLAGYPPFDAIDRDVVADVARAATVTRHADGEEILDAFEAPSEELWVVLTGRVDLWNTTDPEPDEHLGPGRVFGYSSMLTQRSVGPRAVARGEAEVARIPADAVAPAFRSRTGVRFLADHLSQPEPMASDAPSYGIVDELIVREPVVVTPDTPVDEVARLMTDKDTVYAAVRAPAGGYGLITDSRLRRFVLAGGLPPSTPAEKIMKYPAATTLLGESAAEALITLLDRKAECLLVVDRHDELRGAIVGSDFAVSTTTAGVAVRQQIARAAGVDELVERTQRVPHMLDDLLGNGLKASKVIAVYSATVDAIVRRALVLTFDRYPDLSVDAFTWLSLGSNGRREAVPSSDVDAAVAFADGVDAAEQKRYRSAFAEVLAVLTRCGLSTDEHGAAPSREAFARTNPQWRAAAQKWLDDPVRDQGAVMTSLLVDGRPIHGDPGLPAVARVFGDLRAHRGTMALLLEESLSQRAKLRSMRDVLARRGGTFDIKAHALVPVVNIARWAALSVGSAELATPERLRAAAGSQMLPDDSAETLAEVFEVLQRTRLRYQLNQIERGHRASDVLTMQVLSPIDRSVIAQAVREISAVQKRMENLSHYLPAKEWTSRT